MVDVLLTGFLRVGPALKDDSAGRFFMIASKASSEIAPFSARVSSSCNSSVLLLSTFTIITYVLNVSKRAVVADDLVAFLGWHRGRHDYILVIGVFGILAVGAVLVVGTVVDLGMNLLVNVLAFSLCKV